MKIFSNINNYRWLSKPLLLVIFLFPVFLFSCKEIYEPDIQNSNNAIVVQGLMTNIPGQLSVRITQAVPYDSTSNNIPVKNCKVQVYDDTWNMFELKDNGFGTYVNAQAVSEYGRTYYLKITTPDGTVFESTPQSLPERYDQDSIYAATISRTVFSPDAYGKLFKTTQRGMETYVNLSSKNNAFPKCRYETKATILMTYIPPGVIMPPTHYIWKSFNPNVNLNITSSKFEKTVGIVNKHSLCFFSNYVTHYDERENVALAGWLLTVNKYSLSTETHQYYLKIRNQLEASGKIFDPIPSQIVGNMTCKSKSKTLVFGYFEVSYAERLYYRYGLNNEPIPLIRKDGFPGFSNEGETVNEYPAFWYY